MSAPADAPGACVVVRAAGAFEGRQGLSYFAGISAESAGATGLCLHLVTIPPGARAKAHLHASHESAVYVLSGEAVMWHGPALEHRVAVKAGDMVFIPAGVPHLPANPGDAPVTAVIARTDPNEQESVVLRPDLDDRAV
jgi:uncharacterized RmlC-like cupin family protein